MSPAEKATQGHQPPLPMSRATMKDVATRAGVSLSTASRALTRSGYTSAAVRERVDKAAKELRYVPDATARNLRQKVSRAIGVIVSDLRDPFYVDLASGISQHCRRRGYAMILADNGGRADRETEAARSLVASRVAGVVLTPMSGEASAFLIDSGVPVVEVDRQFAAGRCDAVVIDNQTAAHTVTKDLIGLGHKRLALMIDEVNWTTGRDRLAGFKQAVSEAGLPERSATVVTSVLGVTQARGAMAKLLARRNPPTAVLAANSVLAEGAWRELAESGLSVPSDVSLAGFDDVRWMTMVSPPLTTVAQDAFTMGEMAVNTLQERIQKPERPACTVMLAATVVTRGSTAPPKP